MIYIYFNIKLIVVWPRTLKIKFIKRTKEKQTNIKIFTRSNVYDQQIFKQNLFTIYAHNLKQYLSWIKLQKEKSSN